MRQFHFQRPRFVAAVVPSFLALAACSGTIFAPGTGSSGEPGTGGGGVGGGGVGPPGVGSTALSCDAGKLAPTFHRLNGIQYQNTVNQLLGVDLPLRKDLAPDSIVHGFDNGRGQSISAALTQQYMNTARAAVTAALASTTARGKLVPCSLGTNPAACVKTVMQAWLPKVFRRPVTAAEVDEYTNYTTICNSNADAGLSCALQAALLSPKFLFRTEILAGPEAVSCGAAPTLTSTNVGALSQYALASRLSYFLWNSPPDDHLYDLAAKGSLSDPKVLAAEVDRMLAPATLSPNHTPFLTDFPMQWQQLTALETVRPSATTFPMFDDPLRAAMRDESQRYFSEIVLGNKSVLDLVKSDYTFVNERLARHYGIAGVTGPEMRQVNAKGSQRGGLLTQASFLTASSSSENTSIVLRAKWVIKNMLCEDLPQPPPGVTDAVPAPDPALGLTNRESLAMRTANEPCASCHVFINPIGFGLEVFDAVGALRSTDRGKMIDASGELPGGIKFANTAELLELLRNDERFPACITSKLMTYALGRDLVESCDGKALKELTAQFKADNFRLRNHVVRIVQSGLFRSAHARAEVAP
jgi:hypothetical protein